MPWQSEAMKDVLICEKRRLGDKNRYEPGDFRMGKPDVPKVHHLNINT